jgi:hypothetical protein
MQQAIALPIVKGAAAQVSNQLFNSLILRIVSVSLLLTHGEVLMMESGLTLNAVKPTSATPSSKLPVAVVRCYNFAQFV